MTDALTTIGERVPLHRDKLPLVAALIEGQHEHPEGRRLADLAVRQWSAEPADASAPGPDGESTEPTLRIGLGLGVLRPESLVDVVVAGEDDLRARWQLPRPPGLAGP